MIEKLEDGTPTTVATYPTSPTTPIENVGLPAVNMSDVSRIDVVQAFDTRFYMLDNLRFTPQEAQATPVQACMILQGAGLLAARRRG